MLLVEPYEPPAFEEVQDELLAQLAGTPQAMFGLVLGRRIRDLDVTVDPRYGEWVVSDEGARVAQEIGRTIDDPIHADLLPPRLTELH